MDDVLKMVWMVTVILLSLSTHTLCRNPAVKVRVTQKALDYGRNIGMQELQQELKNLNIPNINGRKGKARLSVSGIQVTSFSIPQSTIAFSSGTGMKLGLGNANIDIRGRWRARYRFIRASGSIQVSVRSLSVTQVIRMSSDQTGRPSLTSAGCSASIGGVRVKFRGSKSWLYNRFRRFLEKPIRSAILKQICPKVSGAVNKLESKLKTLKVTSRVDEFAEIDYSLVNRPVITNSFMDLDFKGQFYNIGRRQEPPFTAGPLSFPEQTNHMMQVAISEFFFNSAAFVYHRAGVLQIDITDRMVPRSSPIRLTTTTFGNFIPRIEELYPNLLILMKAHSLRPPNVTMTTDKITVVMTGAVDTFAILPNSSLALLFVLNLDIGISARPSLSGDQLRGSLELNRLGLSLGRSEVGAFQTSNLQQGLFYLTKYIVLPKINAILMKGYPLPSVKQLTFVNPTIKVKEKYLMIATDVKYGS